MIYTKPDSQLVINAQGGYRVLESLGYRTEHGAELERKKAEKRQKAQAFFDEIKEKGIVGYRQSRAVAE